MHSITVAPVSWNRVRPGVEWDQLRRFLLLDPLQNVYLLGAMQQGHVGAAAVSLYAGYQGRDLCAALLVCRDLHLTYAVLAKTPSCPFLLGGLDLRRLRVRRLLGPCDEIEAMQRGLPQGAIRAAHALCFGVTHPQRFQKPDTGAARFATPADLNRLVDFYRDYPLEGYRGEAQLRQAIQGYQRGTGYVLLEVDGEIVSAARVTTEYEQAALLDGAYTPPRHRRKGYQEQVSGLLRARLIEQGKAPVAFEAAQNQAIHNLAHGMGACETADWQVLSLAAPQPPRLTHRIRRRLQRLFHR